MKYPGGAGYFFFFPLAAAGSVLASSPSFSTYFLGFALALPPGPPPTAYI